MAKSVTSKLSKRDRQLGRFFQKHGFKNPFLMVAAFRKADIKPQTAAALLEKESGKGQNIFGCDHGSHGPTPPYCNQKVTEARARKLRSSQYSNGVGPTQLTFKGYVDKARKRGGEWRPYVNMWTGFEIVGNNIRACGSVQEGAAQYNGGPTPNAQAQAYGRDFAQKREQWEGKLERAGFNV